MIFRKIMSLFFLQNEFQVIFDDYNMTIAEYASGLELVFNPPDFLAIYLMAKAFNVDVCVLTENVEWLFTSTRYEKKNDGH